MSPYTKVLSAPPGLGEGTNHSENEQIYHPNFVGYVETSSPGDINLMSYHLIKGVHWCGNRCPYFQNETMQHQL